MADINTADDVYLQARSRVEEWKAEFIKQWNLPQAKMFLDILEKAQPGTIQRLKEANPEKAAEIDQIIGGRNGTRI